MNSAATPAHSSPQLPPGVQLTPQMRNVIERMARAKHAPMHTLTPEAARAFYEAFEARDVEAMMATWAEDEEIVCVHPGGSRLVGPLRCNRPLRPSCSRWRRTIRRHAC